MEGMVLPVFDLLRCSALFDSCFGWNTFTLFVGHVIVEMFYMGLALALASALARFGFGFGLFLCVFLCFSVSGLVYAGVCLLPPFGARK